MKVLVLADFVPCPETSGSKIRAAGILRSLKRYEVHLLILKKKSEAVDHAHLLTMCAHLHVMARPSFSRLKKLGNYFSLRPLLSRKRFHRSIHGEVTRIIRENGIDVIIAETLLMAEYGRRRLDVFTILDEHNLEFVRAARRCRISRAFFSRLKSWLIYQRLQRYELAVIKDFDMVFVCSPIDKETIIRRHPDQDVRVVPNLVDTDYFAFQSTSPESRKIVFIGAMWYEPNRDAVRYFADEVFAELKAERPELEFLIVGNQPARDRRGLAERAGITLTGFVEDVRPIFRDAILSVVPLRMGSGTRLKILASMAVGTPVVSTSIGCEGLSVTDGKDICIADTPARFKARILSLLDDSDFRRRVSEEGRALVEKRYSMAGNEARLAMDWDVLAARLDGSPKSF